MSRWSFVVSVAVSLLAFTGCPSQVRECSPSCAFGDRCNAKTGICVKDEVPTLEVNPITEVVHAASLTVSGTAEDDVGIADGGITFGATLTPFEVMGKKFSVNVETPAVDSKIVPLEVGVFDTGLQSKVVKLDVTVDRVGPVVALTNPPALVGGAMVRLEGTSSDGSGRVSLQADFGGGPVSATVAASGDWFVTVAPPQGKDSEDAPLILSALDKYDNPTTTTVQLKVDTKGPTFALTAPTGAAGGQSATVRGTANDGSGPVSIASVRFGTTSQDVAVDGGVFETSISLPQGVDNEQRSLIVSGTDRLGNSAEQTFMITVDTQAPAGAFTAPAADALVSGASVNVTGTVMDAAVQSVELDFGDGQGFRAATVMGNAWSVTIPLPSENFVAHAMVARFRDTYGNESMATRTIRVDTVAPAVAITSPAAMALVGGTQLITGATATDPGNVASVSASIAGGTSVNATAGAGSAWSATLPLPTRDYVSASLTFVATDAAGNQGTATVQVTVDNVAPVLTITTPTAGRVFNISDFGGGSNAVNVAWTLTDGDPQVAVTTFNGATISGNPTSAPVTTPATDNYVAYTVPVVARDRANNSTTTNATFTVDRVAPTVTFSPVNGTRNVEPRTVVATFSEQMSGPMDALTLTPASAAPAGTWNGGRTVFTRASLEAYTVFTAAVTSGVTDRAGNAALGQTRFHTAAEVPSNGSVIATNVWGYDVESDNDGVPMVVVIKDSGAGVDRYTFSSSVLNPATGAFAPWSFTLNAQNSVYEYQAFSFNSVNADLTSATVRGAHFHTEQRNCTSVCFSEFPDRRVYSLNNQPMVTEVGGTMIASPAIPGGGDGTGMIGRVNGSTYTRDPGVSYSFTMTGLVGRKVATNISRWNVAGNAAPPNLQVESYKCTGWSGSSYCFPIGSTVLSDVAAGASWSGATSNLMSMATAASECTMLSYPSTTGRRVAVIADTLSRAPCSGFCVYTLTTTTSAAPTSDFVIGRGIGTTLLGVGTNGGAQLYSTTNCSTWVPVGVPVPGATDFKPVMLGTRPGFLYLDSSRTLRLHRP